MTESRDNAARPRPRQLPQAVAAAFFAALSLAFVVLHVRVFAPVAARTGRDAPVATDRAPLAAALAPEAVAARVRALADLGSRAPGQPGLEAAATAIEAAFDRLGLETYRQEVEIPYPLLREGSGWVSNATFRLDVLPFGPNFVQTVTTGAKGLDGELFLATEEAIRDGRDFTGKIAVLDTAGPLFPAFALDPVRYADLGFSAIVVTHAEGLEKAPWDGRASTETRVANVPVNIVRVACGPEILAHIGERVHLDVRSVWGARRTRNVVGVLRGAHTNAAALVVPVEYDAFSALPDLAYGSLQALQTAVMLQLAEGLAPYRDILRRDVVFVAATGSGHAKSGLGRLISTIGENGRRDFPPAYFEAKIAEHRRILALIDRLLALFDDSRFAVPGEADRTRTLIEGLPAEARRYLAERHAALARQAVFLEEERLLQAKIVYERDPRDLSSPAFAAYCAARRHHDDVNALSALPLVQLLRRPSAAALRLPLPGGGEAPVREALRATLAKFAAFHGDQLRAREEDLALQRMFARYGDFFALGTRCAPCAETEGGVERIGVAGGRGVSTGDALELSYTIVREAAHALGLDAAVSVARGDWNAFSGLFTTQVDFDTQPFAVVSYPAYTLASVGERVRNPFFPFRQTEMENLASARHMLAIFGETARALALGRGDFNRLPLWGPVAVRGAVLAAGVGSSAIPNFAVEGALVCSLDSKPCMLTDPYGRYENPFLLTPAFSWLRHRTYQVFLFDADGVVTHVKDFGSAAQSVYASKAMRYDNTPVNHILYRGAPVALLNRVNPQTLKSFADIAPVRCRGLAAFPSTCPFQGYRVLMDFLPPDARFHLLLKDGAANNEYVSATRAFCLGTLHADDPAWIPTENEIDGPGYLAADHPFFRNLPEEALASMSWLAEKRLALQTAYHMADDLTLAFDRKSAALATNVAARAAETPYLARQQEYGAALSYQILNHPVIRATVSEAVAGILWYLGLLVPFAFFFEKLAFGFADIRRRLLVQGAVFLCAFCLLRLLHPAFHMIRSSAMILLGFVIMITVGAVTLLLSGKFRECLDALRGGAAKGVSGNGFGIALTAFVLGLNNMHRRRLRTGLTCATLTLMTFATICFLTVNAHIVDSERAIGRANYQGLVIRKKQFRPITTAETDAFRLAFPAHSVSRRDFFAAYYNHTTLLPDSPTFQLEVGEGDRSRTRSVRTALGFDATEPLAPKMPLLSTNGWFTAAQQEAVGGPRPVILPDVLATQLGITPEMVDDGPVPILINGNRFFVHNIFDSARFADVTDPDGANLLPFDGLSMNNPKFCAWCVLIAEDTDPRVAAADLVLVLCGDLEMDYRGVRTASLAIDMGDVPYGVAQAEIARYKEQSGAECFYALAGTAFRGSRARTRSLAGLADLLVPLLIAAFTVLNTMKGSVYERQGEIQIYNAIGVAPRHIFFMFVAEALVYAVVGTVLGCLLAQGAGRLLALAGTTGGLDMNFASLTSVYASLAIAAATLLSTWYPARTAMAIAKPADNAGWSMPAPDAEGRLSFQLPFTFTKRDRIAVLAFFMRYFEDFGEGGAGPFFAGEPRLKIADHTDPLADGAYIPALEVRVWLKPFDLGVSQRLEIELATDPETKEFTASATITRLTGTRDAWLRLNRPFIAAVRRRFLHWRAVDDAGKDVLFAEARAALEAFAAKLPQPADSPSRLRRQPPQGGGLICPQPADSPSRLRRQPPHGGGLIRTPSRS